MDVATAFRYNLSQLTKAVTGVNYKGGLHHYKPKPKTVRKRNKTGTTVNIETGTHSDAETWYSCQRGHTFKLKFEF